MNKPLLLGAGLVFWGWQTGFEFVAILLALIIEASHWIKSRWDLEYADFYRITLLCHLFFLVVFYLVATRSTIYWPVALIQWIPLIAAPLVIAQVYCTRGKIYLWSMFLTVGRPSPTKPTKKHMVDLYYPFLVVCGLSASAANLRNYGFLAGVILLTGWALWSERSHRHRPIVWLGAMVIAVIFGYWGQIGLHQFQSLIEHKAVEWFQQFSLSEVDPFHSRTAIGEMGQLKLSDRIVCRVRMRPGAPIPLLLREATYNVYHRSAWFAKLSQFTPLTPAGDQTTWKLAEPLGIDDKHIEVTHYLKNGKGVLKLPNGTLQINNLKVPQMSINTFGCVKVINGPTLVNYHVRFNPILNSDRSPDLIDLMVPENEILLLKKTLREQISTDIPPPLLLKKIKRYFYDNFDYSLSLISPKERHLSLAYFLQKRHSGHCEYFATAAVLLLRVAGVPARYATGYLVNEFSQMEKCFVIRKRHAHAWVMVFVDGQWRNFDPTPPTWPEIESENASHWQPVTDLFSFIQLKLAKWREDDKKQALSGHWLWLLIPMVLYLMRNLYKRQRTTQKSTEPMTDLSSTAVPGANSNFYLIIEYLTNLGFQRRSGETLKNWIRRIDRTAPTAIDIKPLYNLVAMHYRCRFDSDHFPPNDTVRMQKMVNVWLDKHINNREDMG